MPPMGYSQVKHVPLNCKGGNCQSAKTKTRSAHQHFHLAQHFLSAKQRGRSSVQTYILFSSTETLSWSTHLTKKTFQFSPVLSHTQPILQKSSLCDSSSSCFGTTAHSHSKTWELPPINQCGNSLLSHSLHHSAGTDSLNLRSNLSCLLCTEHHELEGRHRFVIKRKINN